MTPRDLFNVLRKDINALAGHTLNVAEFSASVEKNVQDHIDSVSAAFDEKLQAILDGVSHQVDAIKTELSSELDKKLQAFMNDFVAGADAEASAAVAQVGDKVAAITSAPAVKVDTSQGDLLKPAPIKESKAADLSALTPSAAAVDPAAQPVTDPVVQHVDAASGVEVPVPGTGATAAAEVEAPAVDGNAGIDPATGLPVSH